LRVVEKPDAPEFVAAATQAMAGFLFEPGRDAAGQALECELTYSYRFQYDKADESIIQHEAPLDQRTRQEQLNARERLERERRPR
jgi:hypothetical protein